MRKGRIVRRIGRRAACGLLALLIGAAAGCAPATSGAHGMTRQQAGLAYTGQVFSARVEGEILRTGGEKISVCADVTAGAPTPEGERTVAVTYLAPPALSGVTVVRQSGPGGGPTPGDPTPGGATPDPGAVTSVVRLTLTGMTTEVTSGAYDRLLLPVDLLLAEGDIRAVRPTEEGRWVTVEAAGREGTVRTLSFFVPAGGRAPTQARWEEGDLQVELSVELCLP